MRVCIVGASGKLGQYMVQHALDRGYEVVGVCRERSAGKLNPFLGRITVIPGATNDPEVIKRAVAGCDGVLVVLVPRGVQGYSSGTAQAVLGHARPGARLVFSCGWHITRDGQDVYSWKLKPARLEQARWRPDPREQHHAPRGLCSLHGGGARKRRARPRGPGDCRLQNALGARARRHGMNLGAPMPTLDAMPAHVDNPLTGDTIGSG